MEEHDRIFEEVLKILKEKNLTLNAKKCKFHMTQLEFMGFVLSKNGIGPTEEVKAVLTQARELESASEVRSSLGLVNYNARFIPIPLYHYVGLLRMMCHLSLESSRGILSMS